MVAVLRYLVVVRMACTAPSPDTVESVVGEIDGIAAPAGAAP